MVGVGLFAVRLGGRALWLVPLTFVSIAVGFQACSEWQVRSCHMWKLELEYRLSS